MFSVSASPNTLTVPSYEKTKKNLKNYVYTKYKQTFYCQCKFEAQHMKITKPLNCAQGLLKHNEQETQFEKTEVNWEHIVPVSRFQPKTYSKEAHIKSIEISLRFSHKTSLFNLMKSDPHNIVPAHAQTNLKRGRKKLLPINNHKKNDSLCGLKISSFEKKAEPNLSIRGWIARAHLYMSAAYPEVIQLTSEEKQTYQNWHHAHPPGPQEISAIKKSEQIWSHTSKHVSYFSPFFFL
ncbi:MAG: endonuclease [Oligoflexales bacterium]